MAFFSLSHTAQLREPLDRPLLDEFAKEALLHFVPEHPFHTFVIERAQSSNYGLSVLIRLAGLRMPLVAEIRALWIYLPSHAHKCILILLR